MTTSNASRAFVTSAVCLLLIACGRQDPEPPAEEPVADATESLPAAEPPALPRSPAPQGARVFFISPADGETVPNPVRVEFGVEGMALVAAGVQQENAGHHHLLVDAGLPDMSLPIPADAIHIHFGDASTSTELTLAPGEHTLRLLYGDHLHVPHDPPVMSEPITITVE